MDSTETSRRQRVSAEERSRLVSVFRKSGLTQAEFAQQQGLKLSTLHQWLYRSAANKKIRKHFQEIPVSSLLSPVWAAEVALDSGLTLRLSSSARADWIGSVVGALRQSSC
jgi:transposase-like protein